MVSIVGAALRGFGKALGKIGNKASKVSDKTVGNITMGAIGAGVVGAGELAKRKKKKPVRGQNKYGPKGGNKYP